MTMARELRFTLPRWKSGFETARAAARAGKVDHLANAIKQIRQAETAFRSSPKKAARPTRVFVQSPASQLIDACESALPVFVKHKDAINARETVCLLGRVKPTLKSRLERRYVNHLIEDGLKLIRDRGLTF